MDIQETPETPPQRAQFQKVAGDATSSKSTAKKISRRPKEKICYITDSAKRAATLFKRKETLFHNAAKLNALTQAGIFLLIQTPRKRLVWGSEPFMEQYLEGKLKPKEGQEVVKNPMGRSEDEAIDRVPGVSPLESTPDKVEIASPLARVLGINPNKTLAPTLAPREILFRNFPAPVADLISENPAPKVRREEIPVQVIQPDISLTFVRDEDTITNISSS